MAFKRHSENLTIGPVRLRFPTLFVPEQVKLNGVPKGDPLFSAGLVIKGNPVLVEQIRSAQERLVTASWQGVPVPQKFRWALQWGPDVYPGDPNLEGCCIVNSNTRHDMPPEVYKILSTGPAGRVHAPVPDNEQWRVFSGAQAWVNIGLYTYQNSMTSGGIAAGLNIVFLTGKDVGRFDAKVNASAVLAALPDEAFSLSDRAPPIPQFPGSHRSASAEQTIPAGPADDDDIPW